MRQESIIKILAVAIIITLLLVIWMLLQLNRLEKEITQSVLSALPALNQEPNQAPPETATTTPTGDLNITASIVFIALSGPALQPQTPITITVENVSKSPEGKITLNMKTLTNQATAYSSLDVDKLFALVDLEKGAIEPPLEIKGSFNSLPPKTTTAGQIMFEVAPIKNKIILQIGSPDNPKFYEFDFDKKTYKETQIG